MSKAVELAPVQLKALDNKASMFILPIKWSDSFGLVDNGGKVYYDGEVYSLKLLYKFLPIKSGDKIFFTKI